LTVIAGLDPAIHRNKTAARTGRRFFEVKPILFG
jgi:hypothetical protein